VEIIGVVTSLDEQGAFGEFVAEAEPRLRHALVAAYGAELGREATADALAWAWQHWSRVQAMANPQGYLWRVGQTAVRRATRRRAHEVMGGARLERRDERVHEIVVEPALAGAMADLSPQQRAAVMLVHGYGYSLSEAAETLRCSVSTIRNHVKRALARLHAALEADHG
jgi:RNA polymerase sigma-70 factor (ECF subfamily)